MGERQQLRLLVWKKEKWDMLLHCEQNGFHSWTRRVSFKHCE